MTKRQFSAEQATLAIEKTAKLLAQESVSVTTRGARAFIEWHPSGDIKRINLPMVPRDADQEFLDALQGFLDHEVGHALNTEPLKGRALEDSHIKRLGVHPQVIRSMTNIIEDVRIEDAMEEQFRGCKRNLEAVRKFFVERMRRPTLDSIDPSPAGDDERRAYILPIFFRARGGQTACEHFMDDMELWKYVEPYDKLFPDLSERLAALASTEDAANLAAEIVERTCETTPPKDDEAEPEDQQQDGESGDDQTGDEQGEERESDQSGDQETEADNNDDEGGQDDDPEQNEDEGSSDGDQPGDDDEDDEGQSGDDGDTDDSEAEPEPSDDGGDDGDSGEDQGDDEEQDDANSDASDGDDEDASDNSESGDSDDDAGENSDSANDDNESETDGEDDGSEADDNDSETDGSEDTSDGAENAENQDLDGADDTEVDSSEDQSGDIEEVEKMIIGVDYDKIEDFDNCAADEFERLVGDMDTSDPYHIFSRDHDLIEPAQAYEDAPVKYCEDRVEKTTGVLRKELQRLIAARSLSHMVPGKRSGRIHPASLHRLRVGDDRVFARKHEVVTKDTAVSLVVDCSGSMHGAKIQVAMESAWAFSDTLSRLNVDNEVLGFTTNHPYYGNSRAKSYDPVEIERYCRTLGVSSHRVRQVPLYVPIFKAFDENFGIEQKRRMASYPEKGLQGANVDGESVRIAAHRLMQRRAQRRVMIVFSDGMPASDVAGELLDADLRKTVKELEAAKIETIGIGIQTKSVKQYYPKSFVIKNSEELAGTTLRELKAILTN
jgi:cobalamin biosynthesis protein CobT